MGSKKKLKFANPELELMEAWTKLSSPEVNKTTLGATVSAPALLTADPTLIIYLPSSSILVEEESRGSLDGDFP